MMLHADLVTALARYLFCDRLAEVYLILFMSCIYIVPTIFSTLYIYIYIHISICIFGISVARKSRWCIFEASALKYIQSPFSFLVLDSAGEGYFLPVCFPWRFIPYFC